MKSMNRLVFMGLLLSLAACGGSGGSRSPVTGAADGGGAPSGGSAGSSSSGGIVSSPGGDTESGGIGGKLPEEGGDNGEIQSGTLTSGDYDDILNPELYQHYVSNFLQEAGGQVEIPYLNTASRLAVKVIDAAGAPVFGADVQVQVAGETLLSLKTPVNGTIYIYPSFDQLPEMFDVVVHYGEDNMSMSETVELEQLAEQATLELSLPTVAPPAVQLDVALVLDATGSMDDEISYLQVELSQVFRDLKAARPDLDLLTGLVAYRDHGDAFVSAAYPFTNDLTQFDMDLNSVSAAGGGDYPEAMDEAMADAMDLQWREQSIKVLLLVADAPPHDQNILATWATAKRARAEQVHIVPVAASGVADTAEFLMRAMAALTSSRYIFLTDDSGVGNEHDEPSVDCYVVTRLDANIQRVLSGFIDGARVEPQQEEIVRTEGSYNAGICDPMIDETPDVAQLLSPL